MAIPQKYIFNLLPTNYKLMNNMDEIMFHDMQLVNDYKHAEFLSKQFCTENISNISNG